MSFLVVSIRFAVWLRCECRVYARNGKISLVEV